MSAVIQLLLCPKEGKFKNMEDEIVLSFYDSLLRKSDLSLLREGCWLNDRLIGFMFDYFTHNKFKLISDNVLLISPDVTQFLKLGQGLEIGIFVEPLDLPSRKLVFFAVNDSDSTHSAGGSHWSLLVYERQRNIFHHYDSFSSHNSPAARSLAKKMEPFLAAKSSHFVEDRCPQQENGYDCGVYLICFAEELCQNFFDNAEKCVGESILAQDVRQKRTMIKSLILELGRKKT
ncbi:sentrin-specific protease 8-like isoform X1 [Acropora millepora]|uniref:sentrin-specific protease 8-like isoform X1 n=1 Tax=Acropora millepora TaxID=45264 RepID=UPI001CF0F903|nr:sentrin-specific protease 8-like isoform X1 [Acropora millepora]